MPKRISEDATRDQMKQVKFRLREAEYEAFKEVLGGESMQDHFERYVHERLQIKQMEKTILSKILGDHRGLAQ